MKVLIASPSSEVSRQLSSTMVQLAPRATYLHASNPDTVMNQLSRHEVDLAILDLHVFSLKPAASALLRLACPLQLVSTSIEQQIQNHLNQPRPGMLLTFDGNQIENTVAGLPSQLKSAAIRGSEPKNYLPIWGQDSSGDWTKLNAYDLVWAVTEERKVKARDLSGNTYHLRGRLKELELQLAPANFQRIHKCYLANVAHILEVEHWTSGGLLLTMKGPEPNQIPVARRYASEFRRKTGLDAGPVKGA